MIRMSGCGTWEVLQEYNKHTREPRDPVLIGTIERGLHGRRYRAKRAEGEFQMQFTTIDAAYRWLRSQMNWAPGTNGDDE